VNFTGWSSRACDYAILQYQPHQIVSLSDVYGAIVFTLIYGNSLN
jgi:hypothetical protein